MKIVIFGLTVSSTWGNGHATLWRGLCSALVRRGHTVVFFEQDVPYYAENRDMYELPGGGLVLFRDWSAAIAEAQRQLADADAGLVTSFCPHGVAATELLLDLRAACKAFYDLDTPITLTRLGSGETPPWIGPRGLRDFDVVLSFTGGRALEELRTRLGARRVVPLYGSVDPAMHRPVEPVAHFRADLSYLGTYARDRQAALEALFIDPARRLPAKRFVIAGAQYPHDFPWCATSFSFGTSRLRSIRRSSARSRTDSERDARADGGDGLLPVGPAVRGGGLRFPDPQRRMGGYRRLL